MIRTLTFAVALTLVIVGRHEATQTDADWLSGWSHAAGALHENLQARAADMPATTTLVSLPHRVLEPNRALWYARTLDVPRGSALIVNADDGAQVFVDGARLFSKGRMFAVPDAPQSRRLVVIRVLNNAMQGGLRSVHAVPAADQAVEPPGLPSLPAGFPPVESAEFQRRMPAAGEPCRFTAWADSQGGWQTFASLVDVMRRRRSHFSVGVGDLVNDGSDVKAWQSFLSTLAPLAAEMPIVPIAGNHDYDGFYNDLIARHYQHLFRPDGASWFAWSCGPVRLAAIDVNREFPIGITAGTPQHAWLMQEIAGPAWQSARWRILLLHQPPWSRSWEGYDGDAAVREVVERVAADGLDLVIAGHSHAYERLTRRAANSPVAVLITGGAGGGLEAPLARPAPGEGRIELRHHFTEIVASGAVLTGSAIGADGRSFDRWTLRK
jgi:hypothetical protein